MKIKDYEVHPKYQSGSYYFDVALAYLEEVLKWLSSLADLDDFHIALFA